MKQQNGYVLVTALVFLLVLSLVAITAMRSTSLELRMSANAAYKTRALSASESVRTQTNDLIDAHVYHRGWPVSIGGVVPNNTFATAIPTGLSVKDKDVPLDGVPDNFFDGNETGEDLLSHSSLVVDIDFDFDGDGNSTADVRDELDVIGDLRVVRTVAKIAPGSGAEQVAGYAGIGVGAAGGGSYNFFELRSAGRAPANAQATTATEFRYLLR